MKNKSGTIVNIFFKVAFLTLAASSFFRVFMSYEMLKVGYEIGELKHKEITLLEHRSLRRMTLEKLATKEHLSTVAHDATTQTRQTSSLAVQ